MKKLNKQINRIVTLCFFFSLTSQVEGQVNEIAIPTIISGDSILLSINNNGILGSSGKMLKLETTNLSGNQDVIEIIANPAINAQFIEFQYPGISSAQSNINTDGSASFKGLNLGNIYPNLAPEILRIETVEDDGISIIGDDSGDIFLKLINTSTHEIYNDSSTDDFIFNAGIGENISFRDGNIVNMHLDSNGKLGLGTVSPISKFDVHVNGFDGASIRGDGSGDPYLRIQNGANEHYLFSDQNEGNRFVMQSQAGRDIAFNTGLSTRMHIESSSGNVGVATEAPSAKLHVNHNDVSTDGLKLENDVSNESWLIRTTGISGKLQLWFEGIFKGSFNEVSGAYSSVSDKRLKSNITNLKSVISDIMKLRPTQYTFKTDLEMKNNIGLIAQEVQSVFPSVVSTNHNSNSDNTDLLSISYTDLIPIIIKGLQEQQLQIENQQKVIDQLLKE